MFAYTTRVVVLIHGGLFFVLKVTHKLAGVPQPPVLVLPLLLSTEPVRAAVVAVQRRQVVCVIRIGAIARAAQFRARVQLAFE